MSAIEQLEAAELLELIEEIRLRIEFPHGHQDLDRWTGELARVKERLNEVAPRGKHSLRLHDFEIEVARHLAGKIRAARMARGGPWYTQAQLAEAIGLDQPTLSKIERGRRAVSVAELIRIGIELRKPLRYFIEPHPEYVESGWERAPAVKKKVSFDDLFAGFGGDDEDERDEGASDVVREPSP